MESVLADLQTVADIARPIVERIVWATVTSVGDGGEPRTRVMHPVWDWTGPVPVALASARATPIKVRHLAANPRVSCAYWDPQHDTVVIDALATWVPAEDVADAWERVRAVPEPVGFDPATVWPDGPGSDGVGFLRLQAHRIVTTQRVTTSLRWRAAPT